MDEVAKTPQLQRRGNGVFYYRARLPGDVLKAINSNKREWKRRTSKRDAPVEAWSKLVGKNGELKKELWYSLETREGPSADLVILASSKHLGRVAPSSRDPRASPSAASRHL